MSDDLNDETPDNEEKEESFAELFESYSFGMKDDLQIGDKITAKIISIGKDAVFMDAGTKVDGIVERAELLDDEGNMPFSEGDEIELYVVALDEHEKILRFLSERNGKKLAKTLSDHLETKRQSIVKWLQSD